MLTPPTHFRRRLIVLLVGVVLLAFGISLTFDFIRWDDRLHVVENPFLNPVSWSSLVRLWVKPFGALYIPLTYTVWAAVSLVVRSATETGEGLFPPGVFHGLNVLLHAVNALLVFWILERLLARREQGVPARWRAVCAWAGACLFAVHPLQAESVCWVSGLKDVLLGSCFLGSTLFYLRFLESPGPRVRVRFWWASLGMFILGLLAKPTAMVLPLFLLVVDRGVYGRSWRVALRSLVSWLLPSFLVGVLTLLEQPATTLHYGTFFWLRPLIALDALGFYLEKVAVPFALGPDYGRTPERVVREGLFWIPSLLALVVGGVLWRVRKARPYVVPALLALVPLLPVLGLVPFAYQDFSTVADRYSYLCFVGMGLALAQFLAPRPSGRNTAVLALSALVLVGVTFHQAGFWRDSRSVSEHALLINPRCYEAELHLGLDAKERHDFRSALDHTRRAVEYGPYREEAVLNLGAAYATLGDLDSAKAQWLKALELNPKAQEAHTNLGRLAALKGDFDGAIAHYQAAVEIGPVVPMVHETLGALLGQRGRLEDAQRELALAAELLPRSAGAHTNLAHVLLLQGHTAEAERELRRALELTPGNRVAETLLEQLRSAPASPPR